MIAIIDYGVGNIGSVLKAFRFLDIPVCLTDNKELISKANGVVLPGVGAFETGISNLKEKDLVEVIKRVASEGKPILGICLGLQLLFSSSEEGNGAQGLDLITGKVKKFDKKRVGKIPHVGWNEVEFKENKTGDIFSKINYPYTFYFVHSYFVETYEDQLLTGNTTYGSHNFVSYICKDNIRGIQCHPEKSGQIGLEFLKNYSKLCNISNRGNESGDNTSN